METEASRGDDEVQLGLKEEHQKLAAVIKDVHKQLRREYRDNDGDHIKVWEKHTSDAALLERYAYAMQKLATEHWAKHPDTRIEWCRQTSLEYFKGGGITRALERDTRRKSKNQRLEQDMGLPVIKKEDARHVQESKGIRSDDHQEMDEGDQPLQNIGSTMPALTENSCLRLLDVGSCYNPFGDFPEFESIGIDLSPANKNVYQCDFLKLEVTPACPCTDHPNTPLLSSFTEHLVPEPTKSCIVRQLPGAYFHIVVFSLLLEYLPAAEQRWACCMKAKDLLLPHGLLLIVTPDSNSAYRNHPMMRSWREALGYLGFDRWKYHKMEHVHCMAFRKVREHQPEMMPESVEKLMYIPQDLSDACYKDDHLPASQRQGNTCNKTESPTDEADREQFLLSSAGELPLFDDEEDKIETVDNLL